MNPLHPRHLSPMERRRELCRLLALGLVRLHMRTAAADVRETGDESRLAYRVQELAYGGLKPETLKRLPRCRRPRARRSPAKRRSIRLN
jgi:hypothetical protein